MPRDRRSFLKNAARIGAAAPWVLALPGAWAAKDVGKGFRPVEERPPAPSLELADAQGNPHRLADLRGRVVLVNFWATWCQPCLKEMPSLERLWQSMAREAFQVLAVDVGEDAKQVLAFAQRLSPPPTFPLLLDADMKTIAAWGVRGMPTSFLVGKTGRIEQRATGEVDFAAPKTAALIRSLLAAP